MPSLLFCPTQSSDYCFQEKQMSMDLEVCVMDDAGGLLMLRMLANQCWIQPAGRTSFPKAFLNTNIAVDCKSFLSCSPCLRKQRVGQALSQLQENLKCFLLLLLAVFSSSSFISSSSFMYVYLLTTQNVITHLQMSEQISQKKHWPWNSVQVLSMIFQLGFAFTHANKHFMLQPNRSCVLARSMVTSALITETQTEPLLSWSICYWLTVALRYSICALGRHG